MFLDKVSNFGVFVNMKSWQFNFWQRLWKAHRLEKPNKIRSLFAAELKFSDGVISFKMNER